MTPISVNQIGEWILAERARLGEGVLAFDADGTLWSGDVAEDFVHDAIREGWFRAETYDALSTELKKFGLAPAASATGCLAALFHAYEQGQYPSHLMCETIAWASAGYTEWEAQARATIALQRAGLLQRARAEMRAVMSVAATAKIDVYVVSASPTYVVRAGLEVAQFNVQGVIGVDAEQDAHGVFLPRPIRPIPHGPGKVSGLRAVAGSSPLLAAFGDNWLDAHLLRESALPVGVYPKQRLLDIASEIPGLRLLTPAQP